MRSAAICFASMIKIGSETGVRADEVAPDITKAVSFLRLSSRALPISMGIRWSAWRIYGVSGWGGRGPVYFSAASSTPAPMQRTRKHLKGIYFDSTENYAGGSAEVTSQLNGAAFFDGVTDAMQVGFVHRLGQHEPFATLEHARQVRVEAVGEQNESSYLMTNTFEELNPVPTVQASRADDHVEADALYEVGSLFGAGGRYRAIAAVAEHAHDLALGSSIGVHHQHGQGPRQSSSGGGGSPVRMLALDHRKLDLEARLGVRGPEGTEVSAVTLNDPAADTQ